MFKIVEVALLSRFSADEVPNLMNVIHATPNPEMAVEILLGIYKEPVLEPVVVKMKNKHEEQIRTLVRVDFWKDEVYYTYNTEKTKNIYIHKDTDRSLITPENYESFVLPYNDDNSVSYWLPMGEIVTNTQYCSISEWENSSVPEAL